jgi:hypothetical protein
MNPPGGGVVIDPSTYSSGQSGGVVIDPRAHQRFGRAFDLLSSQPEEAGRLFTQMRDGHRSNAINTEGALDPLYVEATFGTALWGKVTAQTFADLRDIRKRAKRLEDVNIGAREMVVRAVAHSRINDDETAMGVLERLFENPDKVCNQGIRVTALIMYVNLLIDRVIRHTGDVRSNALNAIPKKMRSELNTTIASMIQKARADGGADQRALMASLAKVYLYVSEFLLEHRRPLDAKEVIITARALFPDDPGIVSVFSTDLSGHDDSKVEHISPLQQLISGNGVGFMDHLAAGATEFLRSARYSNNAEFWKRAVGGAFIGAAIVSGSSLVLGGDPSFADTMMGVAVAATAVAGAGKVRRGLGAPETRQAFLTGYSDGSFTREAFKEGMKLLGTYALFGGILPFAEILPDAIMATTSGQVHGLGSLTSYLATSVAGRVQDLLSSVSSSGLADGSLQFWRQWVDSSIFAEAINNGLTLPFNHPLDKIFSGVDWHRIPEWARPFSYGGPAGAAHSLFVSAAYLWMGLSGAYAVAKMNPTASVWLDRNLPDYAKWIALPGSFLATSAAMVASGVDPVSSPLLVLFNYLIMHRHWVQSGGSWNIFKKDVLKGLPLAKYMAGGAIQLLYIGPGNAIKPHIPAMAETGAAQFVWHNMEAHCGMVGFLAALGGFHAILTGLSVAQTLKAKYAKAWTYEIPANVIKLMLGWTSLAGNVIAPAIKELGFGGVVTQSYREGGGSPLQVDMLLGLIAKYHKIRLSGEPESVADPSLDQRMLDLHQTMAVNANHIQDQGVRAALRGEAYGFLNTILTSQPIADQLLVLTDAYFMENDERVLIGPHLRNEWYTEIIYRALTDPDTSVDRISAFLDRLRVVSLDPSPSLRPVRHNLIIATMRAMAGTAHGEQIARYFTDGYGNEMVKMYGLENVMAEIERMKRGEGKEAWRSIVPWWRGKVRSWMDKHILSRGVSSVDKFYNAAAMAGRRFKFSAPFTGRSLVENGAPFSAFLLSASQADPVFQTEADSTLYAGSIYGILMTPTQKSFETTDDYEASVIKPLLELIRLNALKVGDNRMDVRHNLLVSVWLASQGPHGELIRTWIAENKHIFQANGIYGMLKVDGVKRHLPRKLSQRSLIRAWFKDNLWDSDISADGRVVYPSPHLKRAR